MNKEPLKLRAYLKETLWGGKRLKDNYNKITELDTIAEAWELSARNNESSLIVGGKFDGMKFSDYLAQYKNEVLGKNAKNFNRFPMLIKLINAEDFLSIQVHPDDGYALEHEDDYGKTEMWYILDCDEGAYIYYGFKSRVTKEELTHCTEQNTVTDILNKVYVKKGDCFFIEAGTVHAIGAGIVLYEIQQNSDVTYRIYDYDRCDKFGNKRELHIQRALDVINFNPTDIKSIYYKKDLLGECEYFTAWKTDINGEEKIKITNDSFVSFTAIDGNGAILYNDKKYEFVKGDTFFIPSQDTTVTICGKCSLLLSKI